MLRSEGLCERCGRQAHSYHHRLKRGQGGKWLPHNVVHVCGHGTTGCHHWIENHPNAASDEGFHVRPWEDAAAIPILLHRNKIRFLTCDSSAYAYVQEDVEPPPL